MNMWNIPWISRVNKQDANILRCLSVIQLFYSVSEISTWKLEFPNLASVPTDNSSIITLTTT
jgi:hypothetical protein